MTSALLGLLVPSWFRVGSGGEVRLATRTVSSPSMRTALPRLTGPVFTVRTRPPVRQQR